MKVLYALIAIILLPIIASASILKGKVTDVNGEVLPYATVYLEGTTNGVNANGKGEYEMTITGGLYKVVCHFIGFKQSSFNLSIKEDETVIHNFKLQDEGLEMKEHVFHASSEDPAYAIIRHAIERRKFHLEQVKSFQTSIYLKGVARSRKLPEKFMGQQINAPELGLDSGKGVLFLTEEDASYYSKGDKERTVIHSSHESGNANGLGFAQFPSVITFYENNINLFGSESRGFISPINDNALNYYKYKLLGEFMENGHMINKIQVTQKRPYEPCFNGIIYIDDDEWAIHSLNMLLAKQSGMDVFDTLRIDQTFLPLQADTWVIKSQVIYVTVKLLVFDITANFVTVYNDQKINEPIPDSIFSKKIISSYDKTANKKDSSYWTTSRPIPLEKDEKRDFVVKDSANKRVSSPAYMDSVRRKGNKLTASELLLSSITLNSKKYTNTYTINPLFLGIGTDNILNFNIVEGINIAPKLNWRHRIDTGKYLHGGVAARYGFSNHHFDLIGRLYYTTEDKSWKNRTWLYGIEGGKYVFQYDADNPVLPVFNSLAALLYRQNDLKLYERYDASAYAGRNYGNGFRWFIKASYQQRLPLDTTTNFSFKGASSTIYYNDNVPAHLLKVTTWEKNDAALLHIKLSYKPGYKYFQYPDYKIGSGSDSQWPMFTLTYDKGVPGIINSVSNFDKAKFFVSDDIRLRLLGSFSYNIGVGGFLNSEYVSIPDLMHLYGNRGIGLASPYLSTFQFAQYYDFSNKEPLYGEGHIEYHLNGLISNKIPLLRQARYYLLFGGNAFYARQSDYYAEAFVGIDNIGWKLFRVLRVDFVQSWDSYRGHNSGIRFGINSKIFSSGRVNETNSEW